MCSRLRNAPLRSPYKKEGSAQLCGWWSLPIIVPQVSTIALALKSCSFWGSPEPIMKWSKGLNIFLQSGTAFNKPSLFAVGLRCTPSVLCHCLRVYWGIASMKEASWTSPQCLPPGKYNWHTLFPRTKEQTQINLGSDLRWQRFKNSSCKQMTMTILWVW